MGADTGAGVGAKVAGEPDTACGWLKAHPFVAAAAMAASITARSSETRPGLRRALSLASFASLASLAPFTAQAGAAEAALATLAALAVRGWDTEGRGWEKAVRFLEVADGLASALACAFGPAVAASLAASCALSIAAWPS